KAYFKENLLKGRRCDLKTEVLDRPSIDSIFFVITKEPKSSLTTETSFPLITEVIKPFDSINYKIDISFNDSLFHYQIFNNKALLFRIGQVRFFDASNKKAYFLRKSS